MDLFKKNDKPAGKAAFQVGMRMMGVKPPLVEPREGNGIQAGSDWVGINQSPDEIDVGIFGGKKR